MKERVLSFWRILSMHFKTFEEFESNAMRLLSDDASRVSFACRYIIYEICGKRFLADFNPLF